MKFHPDINKAPGATDAFKCIGSAYSCLKDKQKRSNYDRFGSEDGPMRQTTTRTTRKYIQFLFTISSNFYYFYFTFNDEFY